MNPIVSKPPKVASLPQLILENPFPAIDIGRRMQWRQSSMKLFRKCRRKFFWQVMVGISPRYRAGALLIGDSFHRALGEWYNGRHCSMEKIAKRIAAEAESEAAKNADFYDESEFEKLRSTIATLTGMLCGYSEIYGSDKQSWVIDRKYVEAEFLVNCGDFDFKGTIDLIAKKRAGNMPFIGEHKTASKITPGYIERLPLDTQNRGYVFGASKGLGVHTSEVLYDVVRKCQLRKKGGETADQFNARISLDYQSRPDFYFYREPLKFRKGDIDAFEYELHQIQKEYMAIIRGDFGNPRDPRSWGPNDGACNEYNKSCNFMQLCTVGLDRGTGMSYKHESEVDDEEEE